MIRKDPVVTLTGMTVKQMRELVKQMGELVKQMRELVKHMGELVKQTAVKIGRSRRLPGEELEIRQQRTDQNYHY